MYYHGQFVNRHGETCEVHILTGGDYTEDVEIGGGSVYFSDDPVEIESEVNDTFDHLLQHSAVIRLDTDSHLADLYSASPLDAVVNIYKGDDCLFAGFIEPLAYNQSYADKWEEVEINCIDVLGALQYYYYGGVMANGVVWSAQRSASEQVTFAKVLENAFAQLTASLCIDAQSGIHFYYDKSKAVASHGTSTLFENISISELLFYGDEEEDTWTMQQCVEEVMRYVNLHIVQRGFDFYIFDWRTLKDGHGAGLDSTIEWHDIFDSTDAESTPRYQTLTASIVEDDECNLTIDEVYNVIEVTADTQGLEDVVESPLDEDDLTSPFTAKQKYMTEIFAHGEGTKAATAFGRLVAGGTSTYENAYMRDWYVRAMEHASWSTYLRDVSGNAVTLTAMSTGTNQQQVPYRAALYPFSCAILQLGKTETQYGDPPSTDSSTPSMSTYLSIAINGDWDAKADSYDDSALSLMQTLGQTCIPVAEYTGTSSTGSLSPVDDDTTNYIVISGSVTLRCTQGFTADWPSLAEECSTTMTGSSSNSFWHNTVYSNENSDGRYYTQKCWEAEDATDTPTASTSLLSTLAPPADDGRQYLDIWPDTADWQLGIKYRVLACMLRVGDKVCVELDASGEDETYEGALKYAYSRGAATYYEWRDYKALEDCESEAEYYAQCIYIGFECATANYVIDEEHDIYNNVTDAMNIEAEGTAIPITKADGLSGVVSFQILGPVQSYASSGFYFARPFYAIDSDKQYHILRHVSAIFLKDFGVKIYSDNAGYEAVATDGEVVYASDTDESYVNKKDDITFAITTALSSERCYELGVSNGVLLSAPTVTDSGDLLATITDQHTGDSAEPEALYVDAYYRECHEPRVILEQALQDKGDIVDVFGRYHHNALNKDFFVQGFSYNLVEGSATLALKEIDE